MQADIHQQGRGKWRGILSSLGVPQDFLKDKHGPCPMCGGVDRFRWDNKDGNGSYICGQCGAGTGVDLLMNFKGLDFKTAADEVRSVLGLAQLEPIKQGMTEAKRKELLRELWKACTPIKAGDPVDKYLTERGLSEKVYHPDLMTCRECYFSQGVNYPAMVAVVRGADGKPATLHRTYLGDGCKADVSEPRRIMPGGVPDVACIRLGEVQEEIGLAEGIETAMAASNLFELPVWSAINTTQLAKWEAPAGVKRVWIFGDNDPKFGGQKSAYTLAHKLAIKGIEARVKIPETSGHDWADIYGEKQ